MDTFDELIDHIRFIDDSGGDTDRRQADAATFYLGLTRRALNDLNDPDSDENRKKEDQ